MIIKLFDKSEILVDPSLDEQINKAIADKSKDMFYVGGQWVNKKNIASTKATSYEGEGLNFPQISAPKYNCVSVGTSIQYAIHHLAKKNHPYDWSKFVRDKKWREKARLAIKAKEPKRKWCDHRVNEHACIEVKANV